MQNNWERAARDEHLFWLQILGDHARFLHDTLAPSETDYITAAQDYIVLFDKLLEKVRANESLPTLKELTIEAQKAAKDIRFLKLQIIRTQLTGQIKIELTPTFINHMVNEAEEYLRILDYLVKQELPPVCHPLHHHLIWLIDAAGHAGAISDSLDKVEAKWKERSKMFEKDFDQFYVKAVEMAGYLRSNVNSFPALERMNHDVNLEMQIFRAFLKEMEEWRLTKEMLGTLTPLMADHMAREECYYLMKLHETTDIKSPDCDPAAPRTER
ncbi:protein of unknown function [Alteribacillus persepolensis]|uniref:DUF2935 domain-containing protein n=1 Tax=Alteribacillus persepolensis TaxID=568899 RepID=A0A1G8GF43_9BACI|nr:DUF2935 domain-containing protein [Alteribacillus persepolensis]SDH92961.1 protein of unknown function [Alteribacillus persepolensis]